jgi:hypothetical protein
MKQIVALFILLLYPCILLAQWTQIGDDIDGEAANDQSGFAISLSADGNTVVIGAQFNADAGSASGHVRVYENNSNVWQQKGNDINGVAVNDKFGFSVSISADGNTIAVGAPDNNSNGFEAGHVRVFEFQGGTWTQIGSDIIGEAFSDHSGYSVSLSADGNRVAIGAPDNGLVEGEGANFGQVRVYENQSGSWVQIGDDIDGENPEDNSGYAVSLNQDGSVVAIGAPNNSNATTGAGAGHVRVYRYQADDWVQIGDDIDGEATTDKFGGAVSLNNVGNILAVGAIDNNSMGHVRVFENLEDTWMQIGDDIDGESVGDNFGVSVSLNADGSILAVGAQFNSSFANKAGYTRIYKNQLGNWQQIDNDIGGEASEDHSGHSVSLSDDGSVIAIGAYLNDGINGANSGHVRVFSNTIVLDIETADSKNRLMVYPIPATDNIHVDLEKSIPRFKILIYNIKGELLYSQDYKNSDYITINTTSFSKGIYVLKLQLGQTYKTVRVVKQ